MLDAVVHLAWLVQPSHDQATLARTNREGTARVIAATRGRGADPRGRLVGGRLRTGAEGSARRRGLARDRVRSSWYGRHKAQVEARLDALEALEALLAGLRERHRPSTPPLPVGVTG